MSTELRERPAHTGAANGGVFASRAVARWAWRLFRREWRQQFLILALIVVAVAATVIGAAVATNTPPPANAGFGTAHDMASFGSPDPKLASQIAALRHRFGRVEVIENQTAAVPGSIETYDLRAQSPGGPFSQPMLSLVSGHYPAGPGQVALTSGLAATFNVKAGDIWREGGKARLVTGIVANPQSLLDSFALVVPGQVSAPTQVTALFDAPGVDTSTIGPNVETPAQAKASNLVNPQTIVTVAVTLGMLLIALLAIGGFTVLAQRRLRSLGMLGSLGATDKHIRMVVWANGVVVGVAGAVAGLILGLAGWLAYRPSLESSAHHVIGVSQLPWRVIGIAMALAIVATFFAAWRPARTVTRVPVVQALSGRPSPPKPVHRLALPLGIGFLVVAFLLVGVASSEGAKDPQDPQAQSEAIRELVLGLVALIVGVVLLSPTCVAILARAGKRTPIAVRLALRDMARYRSRSGSALAAIGIGVLIAVIICVSTAARYGNILDYAGPNLASSQVVLYAPNSPYGPPPAIRPNPQGHPSRRDQPVITVPSASTLQAMATRARGMAASLGSHSVLTLYAAGATLYHAEAGRNWSGPVYVATPQLLHTFGITAAQINTGADILTMRPGLASTTKMQLLYGPSGTGPPPGNGTSSFPCPKGSCLANPAIQEISGLPSGTSAPNTVITEHAIRQLHLKVTISGWFIQAPNPPSAAQISNARLSAATAHLSIETKSSAPSSAEIINWATVFGILLALGILAMSVGLIRSETARDLSTLTAAGATSSARRTIAATTAAALGLLGALLGTVGGYIAAFAFFRDNQMDGVSSLSSIPVQNLLILIVGMPLFAAAAAWILAGHEPQATGHQPIE
ncbi:MAG TPA: FtsX-like permease family protein [Streptosporangiaceae bacterium]